MCGWNYAQKDVIWANMSLGNYAISIQIGRYMNTEKRNVTRTSALTLIDSWPSSKAKGYEMSLNALQTLKSRLRNGTLSKKGEDRLLKAFGFILIREEEYART